MKSTYEEVSDAYMEVLNLFWDCMASINSKKDKLWSRLHVQSARKDTIAAKETLVSEMFASHGWTHAEWDAENQRRVDLLYSKDRE